MPGSDLALLTEAARAAGEIALSFWKRAPRAWDKGGGQGPVTEADLAVNAALETMLRQARPGYGWLSEESPEDPARLDRDRVFVIDPIDGTRAFIAGEAHFAHSLAVAAGGRVTAAVVFLPALDRLYCAARDGVALCDGRPMAASACTRLEEATALTTAPSLDPSHWPGGVPPVKRTFRTSLAWRLCLVGEGRQDALITLRAAWEWDIAAGALIAERAGARVTDAGGAPLAFNRPDPRAAGVLAAPPVLHAALMARRRG